ncbi:beta-lactamase-like protein 2 [Colletotrichum truncatum]|uniref:Beta-lactamase-like protein 2 n=1 Tax=Colletotrichum truncatum TaxID=5467 RepID=A0ACC3YZY0_COLTU|nr:beta-lactamase-like protein 2 [Colletotrichum truncatum]KAF6800857.1 beta-lactamase-like protein 2 [Colletotrichum truncatum]
MRSSTLLTATVLAPLTAASFTCPPLGPVFPAAKNPGAHPAVRAALADFVAAVEAETKDFDGSAVSIGVKSAFEDEPLLDFHHTPKNRDPRGADVVDENTVYRLASVSKVFTVLAALQRDDVIHLDDPITKFIPELRGKRPEGGELDYVDWEEVTVEAVAAHVAGIGADMMTDRAQYEGDWEALGLPRLSPDEKGPSCGGFLGERRCTREDFLSVFKNSRPPIYPVYQSPVYSNPGTALVGLVVEGATGKPFEQVLQELILDPVGMGNTSYPSPPKDLSKLFIPENSTIFDWELGIFNAAGAMYSSTKDMLKFGDAILHHRLLSAAKTRRWLKPTTHTSTPGTFVGMPWEGFISNNLTADGRLVEVFTKGGDIFEYKAGLVLVPEHNFTVSILVAGPEVANAMFPYYQLKINDLLPPLIRALDEAARDEAADGIAGTYADPDSDSRLTLRLDGGWGLSVEDWFMRGFEVIPNLGRYSHRGVNATDMPPDPDARARAYPTGLREGGKKTAWRAVFDTFPPEHRQRIDDLAFWKNASCLTWFTIDRLSYNYKGIDHFEFTYGEDGKVESILPKAFGVDLKRVEDKSGVWSEEL